MQNSRLRPNLLTVRGARGNLSSPRVLPPPATRNLHRQSVVPQPAKLQPLKTSRPIRTLFETLAFNEDGTPRDSKFGGTDLERACDNGAAELLHFEFDYAQFVLPIAANGSYTVVDRMLRPRTLVYIDGIQHYLRLDAEQQDLIQRIALEDMGYIVVRLGYVEIQTDITNALRRVLYAQ